MGTEQSQNKIDMVFLLKLAMLALIARFCIGASYYNVFIAAFKKPLYAFDGEAYSIMGWYIALVLKGVNLFPFPHAFIPNDYSVVAGLYGTIVKFGGVLPHIRDYGVGIYSYLIGLFYYIFGYAPVLLRFFSSMINVASAFIVYSMARKNFNENTARIACISSLFMPSFVLYSASLQRDTLANFLVLFIVYQVLSITRRYGTSVNLMRCAAVLMGLAILYFLRINATLVLAVFIILYGYLKFAYRFRYIAITFAASLFFIPVTGVFLFNFIKSKMVLMINYHLQVSNMGGYAFRLLPESYYKTAPFLADGRQIFYIPQVSQIPLDDCMRGYFNGIANFLFQPSILGFYKLYHWVALPYTLLWYLILLFALVGIWFAMKNVTIERIGLFIILFLFTSSIGMSEANVETLIRHRDMITPIYIIFAAYGIEYLRTFRKDNNGKT